MPEINLRDLVGDIREALERHPKEALVEILTYVFKEYVVQGPEPLEASAAPLRDDLEGLSFAEVMRSVIALNGSYYNTQRMIFQYRCNAYEPGAPTNGC